MPKKKEKPVSLGEITEDQALQVVNLRKAGWGVREIAKTLGLDKSLVSRTIQRALRRVSKKLDRSAKELYAIEYERLEDLHKVLSQRLYQAIKDPSKLDHRAMELLIKLHERRSKMLGFDAPEKIEQTTNINLITFTQEELEQHAKELGITIQASLPHNVPLYLPGEVIEEAEFEIKKNDDSSGSSKENGT